MKKNLLAFSFLFSLALSAPFATLLAEELKLEVTEDSALKTALEKVVGKTVTLRLISGEDVSGVVEAVGPTVVRVGQLTGKEYYAAVVVIDRISALIYRAK